MPGFTVLAVPHRFHAGQRRTTGVSPVSMFVATDPPRHWELYRMALDLAQAGALVPLNEDEQKIIEEIAQKCSRSFRSQ